MLTPESAARIFENRVYLVRIKVGQPCSKWFNLKELRKDDQLTEAIKRNRGSTVDRIPLFEILDDHDKPVFDAAKAYTAVNTVLDSIQARYMLASGEGKAWFVPESKIDELEQAIDTELKDALAEQLQLILDNYDEAKSLFEARLKDVLSDSGESEQFWTLFNQFPTHQEIETKFVVEVIQWEKMKTLEECQEEAIKDRSMAKGKEVVQGMINAFKSKAPGTLDEFYEVAYRLFNDVEGSDGKRTEPMADRATKSLGRLETLRSLWLSLSEPEPILELLFRLCQQIENAVGAVDMADGDRAEIISTALNTATEKLKESFTPTTGKGAQLLWDWLNPEKSLERQIKAAEAEMAEIEDEEQKKSISRKLTRLKNLLKLRLDRLNQLVVEPETVVAITPKILPEAPKKRSTSRRPKSKAKPAEAAEATEVETPAESFETPTKDEEIDPGF